jgi:hypothetical protein
MARSERKMRIRSVQLYMVLKKAGRHSIEGRWAVTTSVILTKKS